MKVYELDTVFSSWVRRSAADEKGRCECVTCGKVQDWRSMDAGHFVPRANMATRWDERNVHPQCLVCNQGKGGNLEAYAVYLDLRYGKGTAESLRMLGRQTRKFMQHEITELTEYYKSKLTEL